METFSDYTEDDRWDWDREDPRQYCVHGNFIGSWWGPDILCGDCELGYDPSLNDLLHPIDKAIEETKIKQKGVQEFIIELSDILDTKSFDITTLTEVYNNFSNMIKKYDEKIISLSKTRKKTIEEYSPFCENFDDKELLYNFRREKIRQYDEFMEEMKNQRNAEL
jgi:DNA repair ATPase RecN